MTRRGVLLALVALLVAGLVRWTRELRVRRGRPAFEPRLRAHLDYLRLDDEVVAAFARDYAADTTRSARGESIDAIASRLLLSTDFFQNGADEAKPLRYVTYYDPYRSPCYNPLRAPLVDERPALGRHRSGTGGEGGSPSVA